MQTDPIISCLAAYSSNTPGRHGRKMQEKKPFFETYKITTGTYLHVCLQRKRKQIRGGSMFDRGEVCLD